MRNPPWWSPVSNPLTDELTNGMEFFIHHEDVPAGRARLGAAGAGPGRAAGALERGPKLTARLGLRRLGVPLLLRAPGFGEVRIGGDVPQATLTGEPGELALFVSGRQRAARVDDRRDRRRPRRRCARPASASDDWPIQIGPDWPGRGANPSLRLIT